jgi:hypothetical protein
VQMLLTAMLVIAFHSALENRVVAFNGIGVDVASTARTYSPLEWVVKSGP